MIYSNHNGIIPINQNIILEGAKFDLFLKNYMNEGKDYKGLKKELKTIIDANNLDSSELKDKSTGFMHTCKRILQICTDLETAAIPVGVAIGSTKGSAGLAIKLGLTGVTAELIPAIVIGGIIAFIVTFISNRIFRYIVDASEFKTIKKDAEDIVKQLRYNAKNTSDKDLAKKYNFEADKLEASIKKYSK